MCLDLMRCQLLFWPQGLDSNQGLIFFILLIINYTSSLQSQYDCNVKFHFNLLAIVSIRKTRVLRKF